MNAKFSRLILYDLFLHEAVVESPVVKAPMPKAIPLTARLRIKGEAIVLLTRQCDLLVLIQISVMTDIHILPEFIYLMLQDFPKTFASIVPKC